VQVAGSDIRVIEYGLAVRKAVDVISHRKNLLES
jgi:hypothetical protein